jgi:hypothetical protein
MSNPVPAREHVGIYGTSVFPLARNVTGPHLHHTHICTTQPWKALKILTILKDLGIDSYFLTAHLRLSFKISKNLQAYVEEYENQSYKILNFIKN